MRQHWTLDPTITYLNHGSFGATPRVVLEKQNEFRAQMEREPVRFFVRELEPLLDEARRVLAEFIGAEDGSGAFTKKPLSDAPHSTLHTPRIAVCPGAEYGPAKRWLPERFAETMRRVSAGCDCE